MERLVVAIKRHTDAPPLDLDAEIAGIRRRYAFWREHPDTELLFSVDIRALAVMVAALEAQGCLEGPFVREEQAP